MSQRDVTMSDKNTDDYIEHELDDMAGSGFSGFMTQIHSNIKKSAPARFVAKKLTQKKNKIAVIRLSGVIADKTMHRKGLSYDDYVDCIDKAFDKGGVKGVALVINSPGGSPAQTSLIASHIRRRAEKDGVPVYAFIEDVAASGGYWLACAADEIYAQATSIVGSIGVISASFGFEEFIAKHDIHRRVYTSGKNKSFMDPFVSVDKKDETHLKDVQRNIHDAFIEWVSLRRGDTLKGSDDELFEGRFWDAVTAMEKGLVDGIAGIHDFAHDKYGEDVKLIDVSPSDGFSLLSLLSLGAEMPDMKADIAEDILQAIESKTLWSRYGL